MSITSISGTPSSVPVEYGRENPNTELASWLTMVQYHSQSGSAESMETLKQLADTIPEYQNLTLAEEEIINRVKNIAQQKTFDPNLSPASKGALTRLLNLPDNCTARRKLTFEDID